MKYIWTDEEGSCRLMTLLSSMPERCPKEGDLGPRQVSQLTEDQTGAEPGVEGCVS